jgi:isoamylase
VGMFLNGAAITSPGPRGERVVDDSFLVLFNASSEPRKWTISGPWGDTWQRVLDTALEGPDPDGDDPVRGDLILTDRSVVVLRLTEE